MGFRSSTKGPATREFEHAYKRFVDDLPELRRKFVESRFEMLQGMHQRYGSEFTFAAWLCEPGAGEHATHAWTTYEEDWQRKRIFTEEGNRSPREQFVDEFNQLLKQKGFDRRLGDNGGGMFFVEKTHPSLRR